MRIDNYRGWADEPLPTSGPGAALPVPPTFDSSTLLGIDVSHYQGNVDFAKVKGAGASFVFIKATEGTTYVDPNFAVYRNACKAAGLPRGFYHFFRAKDDVQAQIDLFVKTVGRPQPGDLPPVLDVEAPEDWTSFTVAQRVAMVLAWLKGVEAALGVRPIIYINNPMTNTVLGNPAAFSGYVLWIAHYTSRPAPSVPLPWTSWTFWQYSETGTIAGISGAVDLNRFAGSLSALQNMQVAGIAAAADETFFGRVRGWLRRLLQSIGL
jgi:lysozyme